MNVEQPGASAFTELSDVPNSYVGAGGKIVSVEVAETGLEFITGGPGGGATWGSITGTLSAQTDLQTALDGKVDENVAITGSTNTKITYDAKGLVTAGAAATTADINDSTNRRYVTDAQLVVIGNTSGTNTGNQTSIVGITGSLAEFNTALTGADFATGGGTVTGASSGTNTGDQTSIVGITGTIAQFNTALTDGDFATGGGTANFLRADGTFAAPTASATITTQEEGVTLSSTVTTLNFVGAGVTAAGAGLAQSSGGDGAPGCGGGGMGGALTGSTAGVQSLGGAGFCIITVY